MFNFFKPNLDNILSKFYKIQSQLEKLVSYNESEILDNKEKIESIKATNTVLEFESSAAKVIISNLKKFLSTKI